MAEDANLERAVKALRGLSLRAKAVALSSEFTHGKMQPAALRWVLEALSEDADEHEKIVKAIEEDLGAARYPVADIARLTAALSGPLSDDADDAGGGDGEPASSPRDPHVLVTRKVRKPSLMPFEKVEFQSDKPAEDEPGGSFEPGAASPTRRKLKFTAGGETAGFSASAFKGLARIRSGAPASGGKPSVLVADDDARSRMMYRAKLEEEGYEVTEAKDGIEAWNYIKSGGVQCAVMDMKMPGYHGLEVLGRMVDSNLILPVVVVSAFDQLANEFVVATYPKLTFLTKPAPPEQVFDAVKGYVKPAKS
jgi:CheY-like chemotaxis protein